MFGKKKYEQEDENSVITEDYKYEVKKEKNYVEISKSVKIYGEKKENVAEVGKIFLGEW